MVTINKVKIPLCAFVVGIALSVLYFNIVHSNQSTTFEERSSSSSSSSSSRYSFISPLLECEAAEGAVEDLGVLKNAAVSKVDSLIKSKKASLVSVYYRDLNNGPWFGINEKEGFIPASLLKVPTMMTVFKVAEDDPSFLNASVEYLGSTLNSQQLIKPREQIVNGRRYTISELIEHMIKYSDNNAALVLDNVLPDEDKDSAYSGLGIAPPSRDNAQVDSMSTRTYASFFRILFNSTFLSAKYSEKALSLLAETDFKEGLVKGVPAGVPVAHKFGERVTDSNVQLHDCGIIYYPKKPYLLCIMSRGSNITDLTNVIAELSKTIYDERLKQIK
jgi:beta-lactamase class A